MRVYRIEDEHNAGPWRAREYGCGMPHVGDWCEEVGLDYGFHNNFPTPSEEGLLEPGKYTSGFESLDQLDEWFPAPLRAVMQREGFRLSVYEIPESCLTRGKKQVAILGESIVRFRLIELLDIITLKEQTP